MASDFKIGTTSGGITSLDGLAEPLPDPQWEFREYRKMTRLGDASTKGRGPRTVIWVFPMLETAQIEQLETFLSDVPIYIQSLKRDGSAAVFEVIMNWNDPAQDGKHQPGFKGWRLGHEIEFVVLSEVV